MCCAQTAARRSSYAQCSCQANEASTASQLAYCSDSIPRSAKDGCWELPGHARTDKSRPRDMSASTLDVRIAPGDIVQMSSSVFSEPREYPGDASGIPGKIPRRSRDPKKRSRKRFWHVHRTIRELFLTTFANNLDRNQAFMDFGRFLGDL